jgi:hypothetical protein
VTPQAQDERSGPNEEQGEGQSPPSMPSMRSGSILDPRCHKFSVAAPRTEARRRRRMPNAMAIPAPVSEAAASHKRSSLWACAAPPNPVWGEPTGTTVANVPVDPPAPGDAPVTPVTPEPPAAPAAGAVGVVVPPPPLAPAAGVVGVVVGVGVVGVVVVVGVVGAAATKLLVNVVAHVTVLPPPLDEPLH